MGWAATRWAWAQKLPYKRKLVLLALADFADDRGECSPTYEQLIDMCCIGRATLWRYLDLMEQNGFFRREKQDNPRGGPFNRFLLALEFAELKPGQIQKQTTDDLERGQFQNEVGQFQNEVGQFQNEVGQFQNEVGQFQNEVGQFQNEPILCQIETDPSRARARTAKEYNYLYLNPPLRYGPPKSNLTSHLTLLPKPEQTPKPRGKHQQAFETFWKSYPKKRKKKPALDIWQRKRLDAKLEMILDDIDKRREDDTYWQDGFVPDPTTYLNQERWDDEITTERVQANRRRRNGAEILAESCKNAFDPDF